MKGATMNTTTNAMTVKRLAARPRMNTRQGGDGESWRCQATMWTADIERMFGPEPTAPCERGNPYGCSRRRCDACIASSEWTASVLGIVQAETGWRLYSFQRGPGYAFAGEPIIFSPRRRPNGNRPTKILRVSWSGGLDI